MITVNTIHGIKRVIFYITQVQELMGGKVIAFGGDFKQVLPVIP